ncbi:TOBE domain-containing protein [Campylobacter ureolyticus]|jgi:molybdenum-pterin binding domain|uniref:TOBE domain-containing protein n=1 Tax=Campylobacter ureolyticus TaxID=827 RepID=UPI0022B3BEF7|nr:TOBE domain-containing protein [Campylobacter ureolyticus]MCZ6117340.1 TOBE domain-containing protein [Campylobacter ureolyticus]
MKISARNILKCKVESLTPGAVNEEVVLKLLNGAKITSIITKNSALNLNLKPNDEVFAIIKSSSIMFGLGEIKISARNVLKGKIVSIKKGEVNAEVCLDLGDGEIITGIITLSSVKKLDLKAGDEASAIIKSSEVMVGVE